MIAISLATILIVGQRMKSIYLSTKSHMFFIDTIRQTQAAMTPIAAFRHDAVNNSHTYNLLANPDSGLQLQSDTYILNDLLREYLSSVPHDR